MSWIARRTLLLRCLVLMTLPLLATGCSRITIAYETAGFFIKGYAKDYLDLEHHQVAAWEATLVQGMAQHRQEELPQLARLFDQVLAAHRDGFDQQNTACLIDRVEILYRRQAAFAARLAAPLLVELTQAQITGLAQRFARESEEDQADQQRRDLARERRKRAERYAEAIAYWTGPLSDAQETLIGEISGRMPDTEPAVVRYRDAKRRQLIAILERGATTTELEAFLVAWLAELRDLPPELDQDGNQLAARLGELLVRLGASLDQTQSQHLERRLRDTKNALLDLQAHPRLADWECATQGGQRHTRALD